MQTKIFSLFSAALLLGGLAGCSSSDDVIDNTVPTAVSENAVGQAIDDVTAEMQSTIYNCAVSGTRAQSDIDAIEKDLPSWPKGLDTTVPSNAVDVKTNTQPWVAGGPWYVAKGESYTLTSKFNLTNTTMYVTGTLTLEGSWTDASKTRIIVKDGGTLIVKTNWNNILGSGGSIYVEKGGTLTVPDGATLNVDQNSKVYVEDGNISAKHILVQGTLYVNGDLKAESFGDMTPNYTRLCVTGKMTSNNADLSTDGYIYVGDGIDAGKHAIIFKSGTKVIAQCGIKGKNITVNSNGVEVHANYINCDNLDQCASSTIFLKDTAFVDVTGTYKNENNGTAFIVMEGDDAVGVLRAKKIEFNGSGSSSQLNDCYIFKTSGNQRLGIDCNTWNYRSGGDVPMSKIDFMNGTVEHISNGKVVDSVGNTPDGVKYSIPADECHGGGYAPGGGKDDNPQPVVVSEGHTHDISATCVQTDGKNVYVSYHKRGNGHSGCIEMLTTTGDITTLKQFVRDHDNAIDFNHIALDKSSKRLYAVGNNKNGGFLGFLCLKDDGTIDCASQKKDDLDSIEIAHKNYLPLQIAMLWEAQLASKKGGKGGDGNCVIVNGNDLDVASTYGYEVFDNTLAELRATKTAGRAKHLAYAPDGNTFYAIHYDDTQIVDSMTEVGLKLEKFNKSDDVMMQSPVFSVDANKVKPNNGKNAICVYDGKVYVCQSMNGLYVYDAITGAQVGYYKENIKSSKTGQDLAICANGVAVDDKYVYVAYGTRGLVVLDRKTLKKVGRFMGQRSANYVALANGYIYVAYGRDNLKVFKMSK
jgi:hypothetical protein